MNMKEEEDYDGEVTAVPVSPRNASPRTVLQVCGLPSSTINLEGTVFCSITWIKSLKLEINGNSSHHQRWQLAGEKPKAGREMKIQRSRSKANR